MATPWLVFAALCLASSGCNGQEEMSIAVEFDPDLLQASGQCCPVGGSQPCIEEDCPAVADDGFRNIADQDASTEWLIDFVSEDSENGPAAEISFNLGQVYNISSIILLSTTQFLPFNWSVSFSADGVAFGPVQDIGNDGLFEQRALPSVGEEPQASHFRLSIALPTMASPSPVALAEVVVVVTGAGLEEEQGCGVCVEGLTRSLLELRTLLENSSSLLGSFNTTQEQILGNGIMESQLSVKEYEDTLLVLAVVLGVLPPLEDGAQISSNVSRLDLVLVPAIPTKLDQLRALLDSIQGLNIDTDDLKVLLDMLEPRLGTLMSNFTELATTATIQRDTLAILVTDLSAELNATLNALREATQILVQLSGRNFSAEMADLELQQALTDEAASLATRLWNSITDIRNQVEGLNATLGDIGSLLQEALDIASDAGRQANQALDNVELVDNIIQQILDLFSEAGALNSTLQAVLTSATLFLDSAENILQMANVSLQSSSSLLPDLANLTTLLRIDVERFSSRLLPYQLPPSCSMEPVCSESELHADMLARNASEIVSSPTTIYTLRRARVFLENIIESGQLFNYSEINQIAFLAQDIARGTLEDLSDVNTTTLLRVSSETLLSTIMLESRSARLNATASRTVSRAESLDSLHALLSSDLSVRRSELEDTRNRTGSLRARTGLEEDANELFQIAEDALNRTRDTDETVEMIEVEIEGVTRSILQTRSNILETSEALNAAENKFESIGVFLNVTREAVTQFVFNVSAFIAENDRIIGEIDDIIAGLADIHSRVNKINSPVELTESNVERSYLSLQPPPGRVINDRIQFESIDLYLWTGSQFSVPSLLFYAGPVYQEEMDNINTQPAGPTNEDYVFLTIELGNMLHIRWNMGGVEGEFVTPGFSQGFSEIFVTRHGTQFQVCYGVSTGGLGLGAACPTGEANNGSLLFRTSNRTAFLLGGWPEGSQLGLPGSVVPLDTYNAFQGQTQLLLFNGMQWGLWNIRGASMTNFIGSFQRSSLAAVNTWRAPRAQASSAPSISFDGTGYLFTEQLADVENFNTRVRDIMITTRPNGERDGLVLYAYDRDLMVSAEVAYSVGNLRLRIRRHDNNVILVDYTQESTTGIIDRSATEGRGLEIIFAEGFGFQINNENFMDVENAVFFSNLSNVQVWYGGVRDDALQSPFIPELTRAGYCGCVDVVVEAQFLTSIFGGDHFLNFYLNSGIQRGFAATCLVSIYTREVSFDGSPGAYLSYRYLSLVAPPNIPLALVGGESANGAKTISFSFVAQQNEGVLLTLLSGESHLVVVMRNGMMEVRVGMGDDVAAVLASTEQVGSGAQQYILLEISSDSYSFYLNGVLQDSSPTVSGVFFDLTTSPVSGGTPFLYVGGIPATELNLPGLEAVSSFHGCMKDLAFNFSAMSFINPSLPIQRRYPDGITYHTCPFLNVTLDPILAVHPEVPLGRECLANDPLVLRNTHGGFHRETTLHTSNVIGLIDSSWNLSMSLRQMSDGHVLTIRSAEGHTIEFGVRNGRAVLSLVATGSASPMESGQVDSAVLEEGVFTPVAISCVVDADLTLLRCSLSVNGILSGGQLQIAHIQPIFFPTLPLQFGRIEGKSGEDERQSFIGCLADLAINGVASGFSDIQTDVECFNMTQSGYGFSGISRFSVRLPEAEISETISVTFQPRRDNGLVLMLMEVNGSSVLAVGMFNGELRLSNFSADSTPLLSSVCNPENPSFYTISLTYTQESVEVAAQGTESVRFPLSARNEPLLLTIGNTPPGFVVPEGSDLFRFLLSANLPSDSPPPGLFGCVNSVMVGGDTFSLQEAVSVENLQIGFCPK